MMIGPWKSACRLLPSAQSIIHVNSDPPEDAPMGWWRCDCGLFILTKETPSRLGPPPRPEAEVDGETVTGCLNG